MQGPSMVNESVSHLIDHKARLMRNSQNYRKYQSELVRDLGLGKPSSHFVVSVLS